MLYLCVVGFDSVKAVRCSGHHAQAMGSRGDIDIGFPVDGRSLLPGIVGHGQQKGVKTQVFYRPGRGKYVTVVGGIEGSAEDADPAPGPAGHDRMLPAYSRPPDAQVGSAGQISAEPETRCEPGFPGL